MNLADTTAHVVRLAAAFAVELTDPLVGSLATYVQQVAQWNRKINLTGARDIEALVEVLLGDAFVLADTALLPSGARLLDVGSGAGAPIVPVLLLRPDLSALCVEPLRKRAAFLRMCSARLGLLGRMRVDERRIDAEHPEALSERFDLACSRATFAPERWLAIGLRLSSAALVMTAGAKAPPLLEEACVEAEREYALPFSGAKRRVTRYCSGRSGRDLRG